MTILARRLSIAAFFALASSTLVGCTTGYSAYVSNKTSQPVFATVYVINGPLLVQSTRIPPGDKAILNTDPVAKKDKVMLEVDTQGNPGHPPSMILPPGRTVVQVKEESKASDTHIHLEIVQ